MGGWVAGWLACWLAGWLVEFVALLVGWLEGWYVWVFISVDMCRSYVGLARACVFFCWHMSVCVVFSLYFLCVAHVCVECRIDTCGYVLYWYESIICRVDTAYMCLFCWHMCV